MVPSTHPLISATWAAPRLLHKSLGILTESFSDPRKEQPGHVFLCLSTQHGPLKDGFSQLSFL